MSTPTCTVLIVEDSPSDQELYRRCLISDPNCVYHFLEADTAKVALELCRTQAIDAILLDYSLPDTNGLAFLEVLNTESQGNAPPVVMVSEQGDERTAVRAIKLGAEDYLAKHHLTPDLLQLTLRSAIENARLRLQLQQSENRFRTSIENLLDCFGICSAIRNQNGQIVDLRIDYLNAAALENNQMTAADIGRGLCEVFPIYRETGLFDAYCRVIETGEPLDKEELIYSDGFGTQHLTRAFDIRASKLDDGIVLAWRDVTARKQLEIDLSQSEQRFREIFNTSYQFIGLLTPDGILLEANQTALDFAGLPREDVIGRPFWDVRWWTISPETQQQLRQAITQAAAGEFVRYEVEVLGAGETTTTIDFSLKPVRDESGQVVLLIPEGRDIGDRLRSEQTRQQIETELRESEARLQRFVKHVPACVAMFDREMRYVAVSDLWRASHSLDGEDLVGRSHYDLFPEIPEQWKEVHQRCLAGAIEICEEDIFPRADGSLDWARWEMRPWYTDVNKIGGVIMFCEVITKRKLAEQQLRRSEERLKVGVQVAEVAIAHFDYTSNQVTLTPEAAVLYGFPANQSVITREQIHATFHPEEREELLAIIQQVLDPAGAGWFAREHRVVWQTGEVRWLNVRKQVFFDRSGASPRPSYAILAALDITARKRTEAEREQLLRESQAARQEAEAANRSKDDFMSLVAHELRTPVSAIMGWAKLLQIRQGDAAIFSKALKTIIRNSETQVQLIEDLLDACRLMYGTLQLKFASVNLIEVVEAAIETVRPTLEEKSLRLEIQLNPVAPIWGDANRLQQVVLNLLTNSIKFTPAGGQVQVLLDQYDSSARIQVHDTGKGIDPSFLPHIFERFWQDQQTVTRKQGLGLGLSIVQYIVKQHSGTIQAESQGEGQGATFTVILPLIEIEATVPEEASTPSPDSIPLSLSGVRVLLVDDELDMLNLTAFILEQAGAVVQVAQNAAAALEQLPQFQPDILISDIAMPEQDGYELLQQLRTLLPERPIPAIAFSAYSSNTRVEKSLQAGFAYHLTKPAEPKELVRVIWSVIQQEKV